MPIVYDAGSQGGANSVTSITVSHTLGAAAYGRMLVVGVITHCSSAVTVNYVRYNGVDMTFLDSVTANGGLLLSELWCMNDTLLPAGGSYNIVASFDRTIDRGCMLFGTSWRGMRQADPTPLYTDSADGVTSRSWTITTRASNSRTIQVAANSLQQTPFATGTDNQLVVSGNHATLIGGGIYRLSQPSIGSKTFGISIVSSASLAVCYTEFLPADWPAVLTDNAFERGMSRGFNRGSYRP